MKEYWKEALTATVAGTVLAGLQLWKNTEQPAPDTPKHACVPDADLAMWQGILNSSNPADFVEYLAHCPNGQFAGIAKNRLQQLVSYPTNTPKSPVQVQPTAITTTTKDNYTFPSVQQPADAGSMVHNVPQNEVTNTNSLADSTTQLSAADAQSRAEAQQRQKEAIAAEAKRQSEAASKAEDQAKPPAAVSAQSISKPSVQIGDSYTYQSTDELDPTSSSITKRTVIATGKGIVLSSLVLNKNKAKPRKHYYDSEWGLINTRNSDNGGKDYTPPLKYFSFPLFPGKTWQQVSTETDIKTGKTRTNTITGTVGEREEVTVPAGAFNAIKVSLDTKLFDPSTGETMNGTDTSWYVPEIRRSVQSIMTDKDGKKVIQLMSYELNSHPVPPITQSLTVRTSVQSFLADSSHMWLVVASRPTIEEAQALARQYQAQYPKTTIFLSENSWYPITVGLLESPKQEYLKGQWIKQGRIPPDSYFTHGEKFRQQLDF